MLKELFVIAIVPSNKKYTLYLYEKKEKYVIPVEFDKRAAALFLAQPGPNQKNRSYPTVYNTVKRLICGLGANLISVTIYKYENDIFYAYLNVIFQNKHLEFNANICDALNIAKRFNSIIYIKEELLDKCGIKVSKKILRDALKD